MKRQSLYNLPLPNFPDLCPMSSLLISPPFIYPGAFTLSLSVEGQFQAARQFCLHHPLKQEVPGNVCALRTGSTEVSILEFSWP